MPGAARPQPGQGAEEGTGLVRHRQRPSRGGIRAAPGLGERKRSQGSGGDASGRYARAAVGICARQRAHRLAANRRGVHLLLAAVAARRHGAQVCRLALCHGAARLVPRSVGQHPVQLSEVDGGCAVQPRLQVELFLELLLGRQSGLSHVSPHSCVTTPHGCVTPHSFDCGQACAGWPGAGSVVVGGHAACGRTPCPHTMQPASRNLTSIDMSCSRRCTSQTCAQGSQACASNVGASCVAGLAIAARTA